MRVRRAQNRRLEGTGPRAEIVNETPAAGQQSRVLDALHRLTGPRNGFDFH